jgi:4-hydroxy 2-oxovalerate aldolase
MNMIEKFKILDCTLRDGGYYTNWDFSRKLTQLFFQSFNQLPVDYLEVGYRSSIMKEYYGEYYYCPPIVLNRMKELSNKKLVIILNEKDIKAEVVKELLTPCIGIITMVRLAIDPQNLSRALILAEKVKSMGFEVGFNVMYMSKWKNQPAFLSEIKNVDGIADFFYMVDSYGGVFPEDVKEIFSLVKEQTNVPIGFHGHNNMELALINSLTAIECGASIIDATITGMGRGAGNLKTELLLTALNAKYNLDIDFNALAEVTDGFTQLQKDYEWGTNLPYMVSGANSLPQKDVMDWVGKRYYSINSIIRALNNQKEKVQDNIKLPKFTIEKSFDNVLILGGGVTAIDNAEYVLEFINNFKGNLAIIHASSRNSAPYAGLKNDQYYCLAGNEGNRLTKVFKELTNFNGICVLPPFPRKMGTFVPKTIQSHAKELSEVSFTQLLNDSHTAIALQTAINLNAKTCYIVGYDGYGNINVGNKEQELFIENETLFQDAKNAGLILKSLTPTRYKNLESDSIFAHI